MAAGPTYVGAGAFAGSAGVAVVSMPAGFVANDILLLIVETANEVCPSDPAGWTPGPGVASGGVGTAAGVSATLIQTWWKRAVGTETTVTIPDSGNHQLGGVTAWRGCVLSGSPIGQSAFSNTGTTAVASLDAPSIGSLTTDSVLLAILALSLTNSSVAFTNPSTPDWASVGKLGSTPSGNAGTLGLAYTHHATSSFSSAWTTGSGSLNSVMQMGLIELLPGPPENDLTGVGTVSRATGSGSILEEDDIVTAGTVGRVTGSASVTLQENATGAGTIAPLTGSGSILEEDDIVTTGTVGRVTGDASVSLQENASGAGTIASTTGSGSILEEDDVVVTGTIAGLTGGASVTLEADVSGAGTIAPLTGSGSILEEDDIVVGGVVPPTTGDGAISVSTEGNDAIGVGTVPPITGMGSLLAESDIVVQGTIASVLGSAEINDATLCYDVNDDRRELILARLAEVLAAIPGLTLFARNDVTIPEGSLPMIVMTDGDETVKEDTYARGRPASTPNIISAAPEVYLTVSGDDPDVVGALLSEWEAKVVHAVMTDVDLAGLVDNNSVRYIGNDSAIAFGRTVFGQMSFEFAFDYALRVTEPCTAQTVVDGAHTRETILEALLAIAQQTEGVASVSRNENTVPEGMLPRVLLADGSEVSATEAWFRGRPPNAPNVITMQPELYIILSDDASSGPMLNQVRLMLLRGILTNPVLAGLALDGDIRYEGCQTAFAAGRSMTGEMGLAISIKRVSKP